MKLYQSARVTIFVLLVYMGAHGCAGDTPTEVTNDRGVRSTLERVISNPGDSEEFSRLIRESLQAIKTHNTASLDRSFADAISSHEDVIALARAQEAAGNVFLFGPDALPRKLEDDPCNTDKTVVIFVNGVMKLSGGLRRFHRRDRGEASSVRNRRSSCERIL